MDWISYIIVGLILVGMIDALLKRNRQNKLLSKDISRLEKEVLKRAVEIGDLAELNKGLMNQTAALSRSKQFQRDHLQENLDVLLRFQLPDGEIAISPKLRTVVTKDKDGKVIKTVTRATVRRKVNNEYVEVQLIPYFA